MKDIQKRIWDNKVKHNFNTTDVNQEFCYVYAEIAEAYDAWYKKKGDVGEEIADVAIFLYGLSEMLGVDLDREIIKKIKINERRVYKNGLKV